MSEQPCFTAKNLLRVLAGVQSTAKLSAYKLESFFYFMAKAMPGKFLFLKVQGCSGIFAGISWVGSDDLFTCNRCNWLARKGLVRKSTRCLQVRLLPVLSVFRVFRLRTEAK